MRLVCSRCGAGLAPTWSGLRCPRLNACGRGGLVESAQTLHPLASQQPAASGVRA